jgi:hypothetical protein
LRIAMSEPRLQHHISGIEYQRRLHGILHPTIL